MEPNEKIPYVYLTSHSHSGSTLTSMLMGMHLEIATVGELRGPLTDVSAYPCSCGRLLREDPFWLEISDVINRYQIEFDLNEYFDTHFYFHSNPVLRRIRTGSLRSNFAEKLRDWVMFSFWPGHDKAIRARLKRNEVFASAVLEVTGKSIFFDASKDPMRIRWLQLSGIFDLYVVHLVRDVRGVVASILRHYSHQTATKATKLWLWRERNICRQLQWVPLSRRFFVRYEDIATNTLATLNKLYSFVGVDQLDKLGNFHEVDHHIIGNSMRKKASSEIKLDERWRFTLSEEQLQEISKVAKTGLNGSCRELLES